MVERGRWRSSSSNPWSKQGELEQVTQHRVHSGVKYLQGLSLLFDHGQNKKWILSWLNGISSISDRPHCHLPFQWHYCGASGTLFFTTSHQIFIEIDYILPEPSITQAEQSYLSQVGLYLSTFPHRRDALNTYSSSWPFTGLAPRCPRLPYTGTSRIRPRTPVVSHQARVEGKGRFPWLPEITPSNATQKTLLTFFAAKVHITQNPC